MKPGYIINTASTIVLYNLRYLWRSDAEGEPCNINTSDTEQRLCRIACLGHLWERTSKHAQQRLKILGFFADYGAAATSDAFDVSRRTRYRWKQTLRQAGGDRGSPDCQILRAQASATATAPMLAKANPPTARAIPQPRQSQTAGLAETLV